MFAKKWLYLLEIQNLLKKIKNIYSETFKHCIDKYWHFAGIALILTKLKLQKPNAYLKLKS